MSNETEEKVMNLFAIIGGAVGSLTGAGIGFGQFGLGGLLAFAVLGAVLGYFAGAFVSAPFAGIIGAVEDHWESWPMWVGIIVFGFIVFLLWGVGA